MNKLYLNEDDIRAIVSESVDRMGYNANEMTQDQINEVIGTALKVLKSVGRGAGKNMVKYGSRMSKANSNTLRTLGKGLVKDGSKLQKRPLLNMAKYGAAYGAGKSVFGGKDDNDANYDYDYNQSIYEAVDRVIKRKVK